MVRPCPKYSHRENEGRIGRAVFLGSHQPGRVRTAQRCIPWKLQRLKRNGFRDLPRSTKGRKHTATKLSGYTGLLHSLLRQGVKNSFVVLKRLQQAEFDGGATIVKEYIAAHKHLIPAKRQRVAPQGNRGHRYTTAPGETYRMDWGFTDVLDYTGNTYRAACFAMICHHCSFAKFDFAGKASV